MVEWHLDRMSHWLDMTGLPASERLEWARQELAPLLAVLRLEPPARQAEVLHWLSYLVPQLLAESLALEADAPFPELAVP